MAVGTLAGTVSLWHIATAEEMLTFDGLGGETLVVRFSLDGRRLAAFVEAPGGGEGELRLWSVDR